MYGGGPIIVREELDIYSRDLSKDLSQSSGSRQKEIASSKRGTSNHKSVGGNNNIFARI